MDWKKTFGLKRGIRWQICQECESLNTEVGTKHVDPYQQLGKYSPYNLNFTKTACRPGPASPNAASINNKTKAAQAPSIPSNLSIICQQKL